MILRKRPENESRKVDDDSPSLIKYVLKNKALAWLFVLIWMGVIFGFSAQAHSGEITEAYLGTFNVSVRKCAHMCEYAILFVLLRHAFKLSQPVWARRHNKFAFAGCVFYAMTDEFHQAFVPGRSATINDVLVDSTGAGIALLVSIWLARRTAARAKRRSVSTESQS